MKRLFPVSVLLICAFALGASCKKKEKKQEGGDTPADQMQPAMDPPMKAMEPAMKAMEPAMKAMEPAMKADAMTADGMAAAKPAAGGPPKNMLSAFVSHKVKDWAKWKAAFDKGEAARAKASMVGHWLGHDPKNNKMVYIAVGYTDQAKIDAFMKSDEMKKAMKEAGVVGKADVKWGKMVEMKGPTPDKMPKDTMSVMVMHKVKDWAKWKAAFDKHADVRKKASAIGHSLVRGVKDDKLVGVHIVVTDQKKAKAFMKSADLKKAMKEAGVDGKPQVIWAKDVEYKWYKPAAK